MTEFEYFCVNSSMFTCRKRLLDLFLKFYGINLDFSIVVILQF